MVYVSASQLPGAGDGLFSTNDAPIRLGYFLYVCKLCEN